MPLHLSRAYWADSAFRQLLEHSPALTALEDETYDLVYLAGGHGTMYDFPEDKALQRIVAQHYEAGKFVGAI